MAIASRLTAEIRGTNQAIRNAADAQALIDTAEGAHSEIVNLLQRMRELAVQAANDTNDTSDRENIQQEIDQLVAEIDRISVASTWAGKTLLNGDGAVGAVGGEDTTKSFGFHIGSATGSKDHISVSISAMDAKSLGVGNDTTVTTGLVQDTAVQLAVATAGSSTEFSAEFVTGVSGTHGSATTGKTVLEITSVDSAGDTTGTYPSGTFKISIEGQEVEVTIGAGGTASDPEGIANAVANAINAAGITGVTATAGTGTGAGTNNIVLGNI